ncbi:AAA family ATPase, partial [candidate division KSB1 bacterium]|nr:AAA family ATPase [candidate division KSB1 bacterium]
MAQQLQQQMEPKTNWRMFFWIFIIAIIIFYVVSYYSVNKSTVNITYTKFKEQVKLGNVENIMIKGQQIQGSFAEKYEIPVEGEEDTLTYGSFSTVKPNIEDQELLNILEQNNVEVRAEEEGNSWMRIFLITMLPWILIIGIFIYARRKMQGQMGGQMGNLFNVGKSKAKKYQKSPGGATYDDVAGLKNAKKDLKEIIEYLKEPDKFAALGANIPKGILLVGPPGTGKTLLARATAGEADCEFFSISGSEFIEMFVGVGASRVRNMFEDAKKSAPSIIFIDEIDSVGRSRGTGLGGGHDEREQTLNQILAEMDGFAPNESVVVIAATNRPDVLDPALTRPGRFDRRVTLNLPQKEAREKILEIHVKNVPLADDVDLKKLAARTVGFSGADIKNLVNEAALLAGRKEKKEV